MASIPVHLRDLRVRIQFVSFARMPNLIYKACVKTGTVSNTRYIQEAVCARLSADLGLDYEELLNDLPPGRGWALARLHGNDPSKYDNVTAGVK